MKAPKPLVAGGHSDRCASLLGQGCDCRSPWAENCPECDSGVVVQVGSQCRETGHIPFACSENCGWSS